MLVFSFFQKFAITSPCKSWFFCKTKSKLQQKTTGKANQEHVSKVSKKKSLRRDSANIEIVPKCGCDSATTQGG